MAKKSYPAPIPPVWNRLSITPERWREYQTFNPSNLGNISYENMSNYLVYDLNKDLINNIKDFKPFLEKDAIGDYSNPIMVQGLKNKMMKQGWALDTKTGSQVALPKDLISFMTGTPETTPTISQQAITPAATQPVVPATTGKIIRQPGDPKYVAPTNTPPAYTSPMGYPKTPMPYNNALHTNGGVLNYNQQFLDGGPLVDKTNHGKLLNSVYASALGNYYANGGYLGDKGNTQVHTDKAGNTTTKFTKPDGTEYIKVKNANGKVYNKTIPAMKPMAYTQSEEYKQGIQYPMFNQKFETLQNSVNQKATLPQDIENKKDMLGDLQKEKEAFAIRQSKDQISKGKAPRAPQSLGDKITDIAFNPMTAAGHWMRGQEVPDYLQESLDNGTYGYWANGVWHTERNPLDAVTDITPIGAVHSVKNITEKATDNVDGNFWTYNTLLDAANIIPTAKLIKGFKVKNTEGPSGTMFPPLAPPDISRLSINSNRAIDLGSDIMKPFKPKNIGVDVVDNVTRDLEPIVNTKGKVIRKPGDAKFDINLKPDAKRSAELDMETFGVYNGKQRVGEVSGNKLSNGDFQTTDIGIDPQFQKQGIGTEIYKQLNKSLPKGNKVKSWGAFVEENGIAPGRNTWQSLEKKGLAKQNEKGIYEMIPEKPSKFESEIDWGKWNSEIPSNQALMQEYNTIEQQTKANGTWMKNPDGSEFAGTPEQFVQQNSENFKKAFGDSKLVNPDGSPTIQYHGSAKKFDTFDESKFQLGDSGYSGKGIYTVPNKEIANSYALSSAKFHKGDIEPTVYELYGQANNPISSSELIKNKKDYDLFNFYREKDWKGDVPIENQMREYDAAISDQLPNVGNIRPWYDAREIVFPTNKQLKSAVGNNGMFDMTNPNIYKAVAPIAIGAGTIGAAASQDTGFANGGQFTRPYSLPEDSFMQGGNNLHNSVYASSMEQYPAPYEYGGPMSHFYASNVEEPATIGKDLAYEFGGTMNTENDNPPNNPVKPTSVSQRTAQIYAIVTNEIAKARAEGKIGPNEDLNVDGVVAQILLESDNGNSRLAKSANNFGGLVAGDGWNGPKSESGKYRKYATPEEGLAAQVGFYLDNPRYRKSGVFNAKTAEEHLKAVQKAGYAESPNYVQNAMGMVNSIPKRLKNAGYVANEQPVAQQQVAPVEQGSDIVIPDALPILHAQPIEIKPNFVPEPITTTGTGGEATLQTPTIAPLESTVPKGWFGSGKSLFLDNTSPFNYGGTMNYRYNNQFAEGGNLDPLTTFDEGGKHSENPLGGIPQGQNAQGGMNLVEEGETKLNSKDYIFSDTLKVDKDTVAEFNLPKTMIGKTFADASKKMNRPDSRRINDSIEKKAKERDLNALMEAQEVFKEKEVAKKMEEIQSLNPGLFEQMQQAQMAQMQPQGQPSPEEMMMQQGQAPMDPNAQPQMDPAMMEQMVAQQQGIPQQYGGQMYYQYGGQMYDFGGKLGEGIKNYGLGMADTTMSYLGMDNVIKDDQYEGFGADVAKGYAKVVGGIGKQVLPMVANMVVPGSGMAISGAQQLGSMVNPQQQPQQFKYGGTFDMPRQQMYMPLDHVTEMGGPRDIQYDGISNPTGFMSTPQRKPLNATLDNPYLNTRSEWELPSTIGQDGFTTKSGEFDNLDPTLENKQTAFNMKETPGQFIGSNIAPAYNLYQGLFGKVDKTPTAGEMFKGVDPYRMNINPAIRATEQAYASAAKDYKNSAGSAGEYLAGRSNLATQEAMNKSALNAQAENAYGQAKMQTDMFNSQGMSAAKLKEYEFALAAQAAKQNYLQEGLKQVGDKTATQQAQQAGLMYANIHGGGNFQVDYTPYTKQLMSIFGNK
jgi:hypothetical protein